MLPVSFRARSLRAAAAAVALTAGLALNTAVLRAEDAIEIHIDKIARTVPIALTGYSGEAAAVLKFDLEVAGFEIVGAERAEYELTGAANGALTGTLVSKVENANRFSRSYPGASTRAQAHALSDDVVLSVTGRKGVASTLIACKVDFGRYREIFVTDYDGANARQMTSDRTIVAAPAWVPHQLKLYYTTYIAGNPDIYSHDLTSGARTPVARFSGLNTSAAISPDGRSVAMILSQAGSPDVWVTDANGGNPRRLTSTREDESSPCWSPDGRTLCFTSRESGRASLYTIPAGGGSMRRLDTGGVINATEPDWSPDGKWIAFTRQSGAGFDICVVPAGGGRAEVLTSGEDPTWAPNSRTLAFTRRVGSAYRLSLLDVPTRRVKDAAQLSGACSQPSWAR